MNPRNGQQGQFPRPKRDLQQVECFNCSDKGHYSSNSPRNAMYCMERRINNHEDSFLVRKQGNTRAGVIRKDSRRQEG